MSSKYVSDKQSSITKGLNEFEYIRFIKNFFKQNNDVKIYPCHSSKVHSVDWNVDGRKLASGSFDKTVVIFTFSQDKLVKDFTLKGHTGSVDQLCWHPTHPYQLCTASLDKTVRIWDVRTSKPTATINTKGENINICWSPNGQTIAVGNKDDLVTYIDTKAVRIKGEQGFKFEVNELSWNNDNDKFFLTSGSGHIHVLNWPDMKSQFTLNAHPATCICIEFDPTGKYFAVGSADASVSIWDASEMACLRTISRLEWPARTISFSHDGRLIASASEDLIIDISSSETGEKIAEINNQSPTFTVAFHPNRYLLAYACDDKDTREYNRDAGTIKLWSSSSSSSSSSNTNSNSTTLINEQILVQ